MAKELPMTYRMACFDADGEPVERFDRLEFEGVDEGLSREDLFMQVAYSHSAVRSYHVRLMQPQEVRKSIRAERRNELIRSVAERALDPVLGPFISEFTKPNC